ncbi:RHS repeat-associated core domain-containing protein [Streptomyces sp. NPDC058659]|uniref:RHS repeat-associated core domain-containing protein n=1 Tax=unclassified Streptomyces TaxID=2593676 RepID=UPI00365BBE35
MSPAPKGRRRRSSLHRWFGRGALAISIALVPQIAVPDGFDLTTSAAASAQEFETPAKPKIDRVEDYDRKAFKPVDATALAAKATKERLAKAQWPTAGKATLPLPTDGTTQAEVGGLPVSLAPVGKRGKRSAGIGAASAGQAEIKVLDQGTARKAGINGVVVSVVPGKSADTADPLRFSLDYSSFADVYGGDFGARLHLVRIPACALTTPDKASCRTQTSVDSKNDTVDQTLSADLSGGTLRTAQPMLLAATAGASSTQGDFGATPLSSSATWSAGGSTGDFNWSYPLRMPPTTAGPAPSLAINYNSGSVDGRTASENNQTSVIGEGFSLTDSYIERKYGSCKDDGQAGKGDLCWKYANATLVLNGKASQLVNNCADAAACTTAERSEAAGGSWRLGDDDASKVEHLTGAANGDNNGEYWKVTTPDGVQYFFGKHKLEGWSDNGTAADDPVTHSAWTAPVFGDDASEPCHASTFDTSACTQAWRWNLDYVVDPHDNVMTYWYGKETNNYAKSGVDSPGTPYVAGGYLKRINYGQRLDSIYSKPASQSVAFVYSQRCTATDCSGLTSTTKANWPDVPFDMICDTGKACTNIIGPAFFTRYRLTLISSYVWSGTGTTMRLVDSWTMEHDFPATGDSSSPSLWLKSIQAHGKADGTTLSMPKTTFGGSAPMPNHVEGGDNTLRYYKWRVRVFTSDTGSKTTVNYSDPQCVRGTTMPASEDNNSLRCFPVYWSQSGGIPELDWFHKYVVDSVVVTDPTGYADAQETHYTYAGGAGWAFADDDGITKDKYRTWSQWRGYSKVTTATGVTTGTQGKTFTLYMRGLDGDKTKGSAVRDEKITDSAGQTIEDSRQYSGFVRESITYDGAEEVSGSITDPWSFRTASHKYTWGTPESWFVKPGTVRTRQKTSTGTRTVSTTTTYDTTYGMATKVDAAGDIAKSGDETCTRSTYARNTTDWLVQFASRIETYGVGCSVTPSLPGDTISDLKTAYDGQAAGVAPTKGDITSSYRLSGYNSGTPTYQTVSTSTYDTLGRPTAVTDSLSRTTKTSYVPAVYGPLTQQTVTDPKLYTATTWLDPAWGKATKVTDANSNTTEWEFDALGRLTSVWKPNRIRAMSDAASIVYTYNVSNTAETWIRTDVLKNDGTTYNSSYQIYDSLLRPRQTQVPAPNGGRVISETLYDDRGLATIANGGIHDNIAPSGSLANTFPGSTPAATETVFDGAGRPTETHFRVYNQPKWTTSTAYEGDRTAYTAASGGTGTLTFTDAYGKTTERREYPGTTPTGSEYTATKYTYTPGGQIETMTGPDKAKWTYTYDLRGRLIESTDPDKGKSTSTYNDTDQVLTSTTTVDGKAKTLIREYDALGRQTGTWEDVKDNAHQLTKNLYDTVAKGKLTAAIRYVGGTTGQIYSNVVTGYDTMGQPAGIKTVLAAADPLVVAGAPQTFTTSTAYNLDGTVQNTILPAVGGLPIETVAYKYNDLGMPTSVEGMTDYVRSIGYSQYGEAEDTRLGTSTTAKHLQVVNRYEDGTRRLSNSHVVDETSVGYLSDVDLSYDASGNVTSIKNKAGVPDNQCFAYDGYRRLTEAWTPASGDCTTAQSVSALGGPAPYWHSWTYKPGGLRETQTIHTTSGDTKTEYNYPAVDESGAGQPHTLTSTVTGTTTANYTYDSLGNTTKRPGTTGDQTLTWNIEGKPATLTEGTKTTTYLHDAGGALLIRRGPTETVLYLPSGQELRYDTVTKKFSGQRYYGAGSGKALRTETGLSWIVDDHHGTASMSVDATTQAVTRRYTKPFGEARGTTPTWVDDKGFLGKPQDEETGLTHIGAREYDPAIGRFISVDPILSPGTHESVNGYTYSRNAPTTFSDPTGLKEIITERGGASDSIYLSTHKASWSGGPGNWVYTQNNDRKVTFRDGSSVTLRTTVTIGKTIKVEHFTKGPDPIPIRKEAAPFTGYAMGSNSNYNPTQSLGVDRGPLATWQKVLLGGAVVVALAVAVAPVAAVAGPACLAAWVACAEGVAEVAAGDAAGSGVAVSGALGATAVASAGRNKAATAATKCNSFVPGTKVLMADGTTKPIEKVRVGDKVLAADPKTGTVRPETVTAEIRGQGTKRLVNLTIDVDGPGGTKSARISATAGHPFWVAAERQWIDATDLRPDQMLQTNIGTYLRIDAIQRKTALNAKVYNLTVSNLHTYYVLAGSTPVLVHNSSGNASIDDFRGGYYFHTVLNTAQGNIDVGAFVEIDGNKLVLDNVSIYGANGDLPRGSVGASDFLALKRKVTDAAAAQGFERLEVNWLRTSSGPENGKSGKWNIDLPKGC